ncbi:MAG: hypothetical protein ABDH61_00240 [Acidilobaceae archaeon]
MRALALLMVLLLILPTSAQESRHNALFGWIVVPAVDGGGGGSLLNVTVLVKYPGSGQAKVMTEVGESNVEELTRSSMIMAFMVGSLLAGYHWGLFDVSITIKTREKVSGPSGGFAVALLTYSLLLTMRNFSISDYAVTGAISPEGLSSRVGGVDTKCRVAQSRGLFLMVPTSNVRDLSAACVSSFPVTGVLEAFEAVAGMSALVGNISFRMPEGFNPAMKRAALELINLTDSTRGGLSPQARQSLARAREQLDRSPYSAASLAFAAYAEALRVQHEQAVQSGGLSWLRQEIERVKAEQRELRRRLDSQEREGSVYYVEFLATAYTRLADANSSLVAAEGTLNRGGAISDAISYLAFAKARIETVKVWLRTAEAVREGRPKIDERDLRVAALLFGKYVEAATNYAIRYVEHVIRYYSPTNVESLRMGAQIVDSLRKQGRAAIEAENYVAAIGFYREAFSRSISTLFVPPDITDRAFADEYRRELRNVLFLLSSYAYSRGLVSGLSPAYLEFSKVRYDYGDFSASVALMQEAVASTVLWSSLAATKSLPSQGWESTERADGESPMPSPRQPLPAPLSYAYALVFLAAAFTLGMILAMWIVLKISWRAPPG